MVKCPKCDSENKAEARFCHNCGTKLGSDPYNLDGKAREYGSTTGTTGGSHSAYYDHSANSGASNSTKSGASSSSSFSGSRSSSSSSSRSSPSALGALKDRIEGNSGSGSSSALGGLKNNFNGLSTFKKIIVCCCAVYIVIALLEVGSHVLLGTPLEPYTEDEATSHDYTSIDLDDDGALCLEELQIEYDNVSSSEMESIFYKADKNGNHLIKGAEYDNVVYRVNEYFKELQKPKKTYSSSSSKSSSNSSYENPFPLRKNSYSEAEETCPYCGSEAIYSTGNGYKCSACGASISNPDDLNLNYEEGYY